MKHSLILRIVAKFLIPVIVLFALYVQFHGDYGPGGGFQDFGDLGNFGDVFSDLFGDLFGGRRGARPSRGRRGADLRYNLEVDLGDVLAVVAADADDLPRLRGREQRGVEEIAIEDLLTIAPAASRRRLRRGSGRARPRAARSPPPPRRRRAAARCAAACRT